MKKIVLLLLIYPVCIFAQGSKDYDFTLSAGGKNVQKYNTTTKDWSQPLTDGVSLRFGDIIKAKDRFTLKTKSPWWDPFDWLSKDITLDDTRGKFITLNKDIFNKSIKESYPVTTDVTSLGNNKLIDLFLASNENETPNRFNVESELIRVDKTKNISTILENDTVSLSETDYVALTLVNKDPIPIRFFILWKDTVWDSFFPRDSNQSYMIKPYSTFNAFLKLDSSLGRRMILILPMKISESFSDKDFFELIDSLNNGGVSLPYLDKAKYHIHNFTIVQ